MSSSATISFEPDTIGITLDAFRKFCADNGIVHSPRTVGGNVYYQGGPGGVEVVYTRYRLTISTFHNGPRALDVAALAMLMWLWWGGSLTAAPEIRRHIGIRR